MQDKKIRMPITEAKPVPKFFRQNVVRICIFTILFQPLYFPIFVYNRRKALQDEVTLPRYFFHILLPMIGVGINMVTFGLFYYFTVQSLAPDQRSFSNIMASVESSHSIWSSALQISLILALLCFIVAVGDMLASMDGVLKRFKVRFPQYLQYAPYIFIGVSIAYTLSEVLLIQNTQDQTSIIFVIIMQVLFVVSLVLVHMYITNVYMLMRALQIKKEN